MLKISIFFSLLLLTHAISFAGDSTLIWEKASYAKMLDAAKSEQKNIMICFFPDSSHTGNCYMDITQVLSTNKKITYFLNAHFLNFIVNPMSEEGIELNERFKLKQYPAYIFIDTSGKLIHKFVGLYKEAKFLEEADKALSKKLSYSQLKKQYESGDRQPDVLLNYCYALQNAGERDSATIKPVIDEYLNTQPLSALRNPKNIKFIYDFAVVEFKCMLTYDSKAFQFLYNNNDLFLKYFTKENIDIRIVWILSDAVYSTIIKKDEKIFKKTIDLLRKYDNGKEYDWKNEQGGITGWLMYTHLVSWNTLEFYENFGDKEKYKNAFDAYTKDIWNNWDDLNSLAWDYYEKYSDEYKLNNALKCIKRSIELNANSDNIDTYASLLYKTGNYKDALVQEELALEKAKEAKKELTPFNQSIDKIKAALKDK